MKVVLIHPPCDASSAGVGRVYPQTLPPSNLELIACAIDAHVPRCEVQVLDGNLLSIGDIVDSLDADIVGVSSWAVNQHTALELARQAKDRRPETFVVLGGPNAEHLATRILENQSYVDAIVVGDGEEAVVALARGEALSNVPNLVYRKDCAVTATPTVRPSLDTRPRPKSDHVNNRR